MAAINIKEIKVGTIFKNMNGDLEQVIRIDGTNKFARMYACKWINEDGSLSAGEDWMVASHFKYCEAVSY